MNFEIEERHLNMLNAILKKYNHSFFVFSSRVRGTSRKLSDVDLLYFEKIGDQELMQLKEELEESDLPYKVDLVDYNACNENFKKRIGDQYICLQSRLNFTRNRP